VCGEDKILAFLLSILLGATETSGPIFNILLLLINNMHQRTNPWKDKTRVIGDSEAFFFLANKNKQIRKKKAFSSPHNTAKINLSFK
jgi:hypothetical protein